MCANFMWILFICRILGLLLYNFWESGSLIKCESNFTIIQQLKILENFKLNFKDNFSSIWIQYLSHCWKFLKITHYFWDWMWKQFYQLIKQYYYPMNTVPFWSQNILRIRTSEIKCEKDFSGTIIHWISFWFSTVLL